MPAPRLFLITLLGLTLIWAVPTHSAEPASTLVKDINTTNGTLPGVSNFAGFIKTLGNQALFLANDSEHGTELWRTDGTTAGTQLLADLNPGPAGVSITATTNAVVAGSRLFFAVTDNSNIALWVSDGTTIGTHRVNNARIEAPSELTAVGERVFFTTYNNMTHVAQLWVSDGSTLSSVKRWDGTVIPTALNVLGNTLLFVFNDTTYGSEIWRSDGTEAGTQRVTDLNPGTGNTFDTTYGALAPQFGVLNGQSYFFANDGTGVGLWKTDGTTTGTAKVSNIVGSRLEQTGSLLFFQAAHTNAGQTNNWLWKSDGTAVGSVPFYDFGGPPPSSTTPTYVTLIGGNYYFQTSYLFVTNTISTTQLSATQLGGSVPPQKYFVGTGNTVFFQGGAFSDEELWVTNGTPQSTQKVRDINPNYYSTPRSLAMLGTQVLFYANDGNTIDIWHSNGTEQDTTKLREQIVPNGIDIPYKYYEKFAGFQMANAGDKLIFAANNGANNAEPWVSDGTSSGTQLLKEIDPTAGSLPLNMVSFGGKAYFEAFTGMQTNLWQTDGTPTGTTLFREASASPVIHASALWYIHQNGTTSELWRSDGSNIGILKTTLPVQTSIIHMLSAGDLLYLIVFVPNSTIELWKSDGNQAGTVKVKTITTNGTGSSNYFRNFTARGNNLFFTTVFSFGIGPTFYEFWVSDGTEAGTIKLISSGILSTPTGVIQHPVAIADKVFFTPPESGIGKLVVSDGTISGTTTLKTFATVYNDSTVRSLANLNGTLLFAGNDGVSGIELWKSDGTEAGTVLLKDINPSIVGSGIDNLTVIGNVVYFSAGDGVTGTALWRTDGTAVGTVKVAEIASGSTSASPRAFTLVGETLFFLANDAATGLELHAISAKIEYQAHLPSVVR